jgi:hypothetical protein
MTQAGNDSYLQKWQNIFDSERLVTFRDSFSFIKGQKFLIIKIISVFPIDLSNKMFKIFYMVYKYKAIQKQMIKSWSWNCSIVKIKVAYTTHLLVLMMTIHYSKLSLSYIS